MEDQSPFEPFRSIIKAKDPKLRSFSQQGTAEDHDNQSRQIADDMAWMRDNPDEPRAIAANKFQNDLKDMPVGGGPGNQYSPAYDAVNIARRARGGQDVGKIGSLLSSTLDIPRQIKSDLKNLGAPGGNGERYHYDMDHPVHQMRSKEKGMLGGYYPHNGSVELYPQNIARFGEPVSNVQFHENTNIGHSGDSDFGWWAGMNQYYPRNDYPSPGPTSLWDTVSQTKDSRGIRLRVANQMDARNLAEAARDRYSLEDDPDYQTLLIYPQSPQHVGGRESRQIRNSLPRVEYKLKPEDWKGTLGDQIYAGHAEKQRNIELKELLIKQGYEPEYADKLTGLIMGDRRNMIQNGLGPAFINGVSYRGLGSPRTGKVKYIYDPQWRPYYPPDTQNRSDSTELFVRYGQPLISNYSVGDKYMVNPKEFPEGYKTYSNIIEQNMLPYMHYLHKSAWGPGDLCDSFKAKKILKGLSKSSIGKEYLEHLNQRAEVIIRAMGQR